MALSTATTFLSSQVSSALHSSRLDASGLTAFAVAKKVHCNYLCEPDKCRSIYKIGAREHDLLYRNKAYGTESRLLIKLAKRRCPSGVSLLDVACGTGRHDFYLKTEFAVDGVDIDRGYIRQAKRRNPNGRYWCADMRSIAAGCAYDVAICLFGSIAFLNTLKDVAAFARCIARQIKPGGYVFVEPGLTPEEWVPNKVFCSNVRRGQRVISRICCSKEGGVSDCQYLIGSENGVFHIREKHELGLFTTEGLCEVFEEAGIQVEVDHPGISGRGLLIGRVIA